MNSARETYKVLKSDREPGIKLLYEQYGRKLLGYATKNWKTGEDEAWDLIYKTIYKVADTIKNYEFETEQAFASFVFRIFINNLKDHIRKQKKVLDGLTEVQLHDNLTGPEEPNESSASPNKPLEILKSELDKLEDWERILVLMRSQEMPYSEIAKYVDKPENQLKTYYARLKKQLSERVTALINISETKENV